MVLILSKSFFSVYLLRIFVILKYKQFERKQNMSYKEWKETYEKILSMYSEFEKLFNSAELSKRWKVQQNIQAAWENLNDEYLLRFRGERLNSI